MWKSILFSRPLDSTTHSLENIIFTLSRTESKEKQSLSPLSALTHDTVSHTHRTHTVYKMPSEFRHTTHTQSNFLTPKQMKKKCQRTWPEALFLSLDTETIFWSIWQCHVFPSLKLPSLLGSPQEITVCLLLLSLSFYCLPSSPPLHLSLDTAIKSILLIFFY